MVNSSQGQLVTHASRNTVSSSREYITKTPVVKFFICTARRSGNTQKRCSTWMAYLRQASIQQDIRNAVQFGLVIWVSCNSNRNSRSEEITSRAILNIKYAILKSPTMAKLLNATNARSKSTVNSSQCRQR